MAIKRKALLWCVLATLLVGYLIGLANNHSLNINSNILSLLPATEVDPAIEQAFANFSEQNMRQLVFLVANADKNTAMQSADELAQALRSNPWIATVDLKRGEDAETTAGAFYYQHRHQLLSRSDALLLEAGNFDAFSEDTIRQIYAPFSGGLTELVQTDPFLLSVRSANATVLQNAQDLGLTNGYLLTERNGQFHVLLTAELTQSPFNQDLQQHTLADIQAIEQRWAANASGTQLIRTGALFYTAYAYDTARNEVSVIGGGSMLLVLALMLVVFKSVRPLALVFVALSFGIATGFVLVRLLFGEVHLLTLVFGASLIGVAEDYAFHYFSIENASSGEARLRKIMAAISLGLLTSVTGYAALLLTPFPGLQQMAVFCISGLIGAWLTVVLLFPVISLRNKNSPTLLSWCGRLITLSGGKIAKAVLCLTLVLPLLALWSLFSGESVPDDVRNFQARNPDLQSQELYIQQVLNAPAANQFYLVKGSSEENLLTNLEAANDKLTALVTAGAIDGFMNIANWLPSIQMQDANYALYQQLYASDAAQALVETGVLDEAPLASARATFAREREQYLLPQTWLASPVGNAMAYLWLGQSQTADAATPGKGETGASTYAAVIALRNVKQLDLLGDFAAGDSQVVFVDKISTVNIMLADYKSRSVLLLFITCSAIFTILFLRYGARKAALILAVPIIAVSAAVYGLTLLGESLNLFSILPLFLLVGLGVDFGIFFAEDGELSSSTLLTVVLSALTTIFSFGLLALSSTSVIHSFGLTMLIGLSCALLLSPIVGNLIVKHRIVK